MSSIESIPNATARRLRVAALLLVVTVGVGAAAKLGARQPLPDPVPAGDLARTFAAPSSGPVHFSGALESTAVMPSRDRDARMELVIRADAATAGAAPRVPTDLVVVLDRSGSMAGDKIENARAAVRTLIGALGESDRFALVTYSDGAEIRIPLGAAANRDAWYAVANSIQPDGGTNMASGLDAGLAMVDAARSAGRAPRMVLISDGLANQGDASREGLVARATRAARSEFALSTVGVGADFDEGLMAALADAGTGNFHFLADASGLDRILAAEFATARETVASSLRVAITPAPGIEVIDAAGYPLAREAQSVTFTPGSLFAGQERRIWVTLRVPADAKGTVSLGAFALEYGVGRERHRAAFSENPRVAATADEQQYYGSIDAKAFESSVVVDQYNALRRSVAEKVKDGRERDAVAEIQKYRVDVARKNEQVQSPQVAAQLDEAERLEKRMQDAASGAAPASPMELKQLRSLGYSEGRPGSRK
jgi:Ca-activated chloride channel family protein